MKMKKKTIMIIDDEANLIKLVTDVLETEKYEVISCTNGVDALKLLDSVKPDLVILDIMMPYMSGMEVLQKIRENPQTKDLTVILLTVVPKGEISLEEMKRLGVEQFISKPFEIEQLVKIINKILKK